MANIQDISLQLMKPFKELASWNFPLQQILENYFNLLPEPCKIHYGEAALVIQNSVNAYVRKVEELYDETKCLCQKIISESKEAEKNCLRVDKKSRKYLLDLEQFQLFDFEKEIGKNINLKISGEKQFKFLHHCFPQLENAFKNLNVRVTDVDGEVFGNKYDLRCNQKITKNGMLLEDFLINDSSDAGMHFENEKILLTSRSNEVNGSTDDISNDCSCKCDESIIHNVTISSKTRPRMSTDSARMESYDSCSYHDSGDSALNLNESMHFEKTTCSNCFKQRMPELNYRNASDENHIFYNKSHPEELYCDPLEKKNCETELCIQGTQNRITGADNFSSNQLQNMKWTSRHEPEVQKNSAGSYKRKISRDIFYYSMNTANVQCLQIRRSRRLKESQIFDTHDKILEAIEFKNGIPKKVEKNRMEFRLPCHPSLLKHSLRKVKYSRTKRLRGISNAAHTNHTKFLSRVPKMKSKMSSPRESQIPLVAEDDDKEFQEVLNGESHIESNFPVHLKPVSASTSNLLDFQPNYTKHDSDFTYPKTAFSGSSESIEYSPRLAPTYNTKMIDSMNNFETSEENRSRRHNNTVHDFEKLIQSRIRIIHEELDLQFHEDQRVARWHEEIKPKLMEAERKPPFFIHEYEFRIIRKLEKSHRKLQFDEIIREEPPAEIARYFSATLQLASRNNVDIYTNEDLNKSIELVLLD